MKPCSSSIPDGDQRLQAAWGLALPCAERVLIIASKPPAGLVDWWRRQGTEVCVVSPEQLQDATAKTPAVADADADADAFDLLLLWDVEVGALGAQLLAAVRSACREVAVWTAWAGALGALRTAVSEARLRHMRWVRQGRFYAWPDLQRPRQIVEHEDWTSTPLHMHRRSQSWWKTALLQSPFGRSWAPPASLSRWHRADAGRTPSVLQDIVLQASASIDTSLVVGQQRLSPNGVAIVQLLRSDSGQPLGILKVPLTERTALRVAINAQALAWMQEQRHLVGDWSDASPRLLAAAQTHGCPWTLEEHATGSEAQTWEPAAARQATVHLSELLGRYQRAAVARTDVGPLQARLQPQVDAVCALLDADLAQALQEIWGNTVRNLQGVRVPIVPQHGDCKLENVLGDPRRPTQLRLLDWELWRPDGLPLLDLLHLLLSRRRRQAGYSIGGSICRWLLPWDFAPWEQRLIDDLAQDLDRHYVRATPFLYWLERLGPIVERGAWPHAGWVQANVEQVIERMKHRQAEVLA